MHRVVGWGELPFCATVLFYQAELCEHNKFDSVNRKLLFCGAELLIRLVSIVYNTNWKQTWDQLIGWIIFVSEKK